MSKLTLATQAKRIAQVLRVIALTQAGSTIHDAVSTTGITVDIYYDWLAKAPEAVDLFYGLIQESERRELSDILTRRERITRNLLDKISLPTASNLDIIAGLSYIDKRQDALESRQGVANQSEINASEYLQGPKTSKKPSRMTATVVIDGPGSVTVTQHDHDVIDASFRDQDLGADASQIQEED